MRIPDYRVWVKKEKKMYGIDGQGGFVDYIRACGEGDAFGTDVQITDDCGDYQSYTFDEVEVMEFTGLKDKDGGKIYEGDIVKQRAGNFAVEYSNEFGYNNFAGFIPFCYDCGSETSGDGCIIIGNIYENPELLPK